MNSQARTIGSQVADTGRLNAKDFVFCAVFGVLLFLVTMVVAGIAGIDYRTAWFSHAISSLVTGMIWMFLVQRVPKRGAMIVAGVVAAVVGFLMGMFWSGPAAIVVGAIIADLILGNPRTRAKGRVLASFPVFMTLFWLGHISLVYIIGGDAYAAQCMQMGLSADYAHNLVSFMYGPWMVLAGVATVICSTLGGWIGMRVLAKHFKHMGLN